MTSITLVLKRFSLCHCLSNFIFDERIANFGLRLSILQVFKQYEWMNISIFCKI
jgi:hypothetical protein